MRANSRLLMLRVNLAIVGGGTVGGGVYQAIQRNGALMAARLGVEFHVRRVVVRDIKRKRPVKVPARLLTADWRDAVMDPKVDIVIETMGGTTEARKVVETALKQGKPVVTANKALLSAHGESLFALSEKHHANLYYEASVAGGIPIIKALRESMVGNRITGLYGIANGTCNYILTRMKEEGLEFGEILADAQRLGYAEADPSLDVGGGDAMHKIGILASLAHGFWVNPKEIFLEGITAVTPLDIQFAETLGYAVKLLGTVKLINDTGGASGTGPRVQVCVCPTLIPDNHVLASVNGVYNAVHVHGDVVGDTLYYGHGAGQNATASAALSDLADAALDLKFGSSNRIPPFVPHEKDGAVVPMDEIVSEYYLRLSVIDRPGTLAKISRILADAKIGISSVIQPEGHEGESVPLMMMIHDAKHGTMEKVLKKIAKLAVVKGAPTLFRVENFD
jgi:homoserine dehydrogenase